MLVLSMCFRRSFLECPCLGMADCRGICVNGISNLISSSCHNCRKTRQSRLPETSCRFILARPNARESVPPTANSTYFSLVSIILINQLLLHLPPLALNCSIAAASNIAIGCLGGTPSRAFATASRWNCNRMAPMVGVEVVSAVRAISMLKARRAT